jgi:hypothetical protein
MRIVTVEWEIPNAVIETIGRFDDIHATILWVCDIDTTASFNT